MKVTFDGEERTVPTGAPVAAFLSPAEREEAAAGKLFVADARGNRVGLAGAAAADAAYFAVAAGARPPAVGACLEALGAASACMLPPELWKFLVRRAIALLRAAGGAGSAAGTAALAVTLANGEDAAAIWAYVAGEGRDAAAFPPGEARLRDVAPQVEVAVVATRDILTLTPGVTLFDYLEGVEVVEVGTTNRVRWDDYRGAVTAAAAVVACNVAGFSIEGFVTAPSPAELADHAGAAGVPFINISAGASFLDERGGVSRRPGDVVIYVAPTEAPEYDVAVGAALPSGVGDGRLKADAAAALWRAVKGRS